MQLEHAGGREDAGVVGPAVARRPGGVQRPAVAVLYHVHQVGRKPQRHHHRGHLHRASHTDITDKTAQERTCSVPRLNLPPRTIPPVQCWLAPTTSFTFYERSCSVCWAADSAALHSDLRANRFGCAEKWFRARYYNCRLAEAEENQQQQHKIQKYMHQYIVNF